MNRVGRISRNLGQAWLTGLWFFLIAYFGVHAFEGDSSLPALKELERKEAFLMQQASAVADERKRLEHRVALLSKEAMDPDMLEEQVRQQLGFMHRDEVVVFTN